MKTTITMIAACAAFTAGAVAAPAAIGAASNAEVVAAKEQTVLLEVSGLKCSAGCPKKVHAALQGVKGVSKVVVGKKVGSNADTTVTAEASVKVADLIAALKKKGFGATQTKKKGDA